MVQAPLAGVVRVAVVQPADGDRRRRARRRDEPLHSPVAGGGDDHHPLLNRLLDQPVQLAELAVRRVVPAERDVDDSYVVAGLVCQDPF